MKRKSIFIVFLFAVMLAACTYNMGLVQSTYKMLATSQVSYDTAMKMAADLYAQQRISDAEKAHIIEIGTVYATAHNNAVEALARYEKTKDAEEQAKMSAMIGAAAVALTDLLELIQPYLGGE